MTAHAMVRDARSYLTLVCLFLFAAPAQAQSLSRGPTSVGLLYFQEKNFRSGDWVLYRVRGADITGEESVDYQRVLIGQELEFRGERCFWLETGWGPHPDSLDYSAALVSEHIFEEEMPTVRHGLYVRKMMIGRDIDDVPRATDVRIANPKRPLADLSYLQPKVKTIGRDTVRVGGRAYVCDVIEESREFSQMRDFPDSTGRYTTETRRLRWVNPKVFITGLVREKERKVFYTQVWPVGRSSKDFPPRIGEIYEIEVELLDMGRDSPPVVSHLMRDTTEDYLPGDVDAPR